MTELKTLKDIEIKPELDEGTQFSPYCHSASLRSEAIKWIKNIDTTLMIESNADFLDKNKISGLNATGEWIKCFFNITEEELK